MPATTDFENDGICVLRISGVLKQTEFAAQQAAIARKIDEGAKPRLLAIAKDFLGWERGTDWNDLDFMFKYGDEIARIAIVAEREWEPKALAFAGAGVREAQVRFFSPDAERQAREWLLE